MNKTRRNVKDIGTKEEFLQSYRRLLARRDKAAADSVRLTNVLNQMRLGAIDQGWEITSEDLGR